MIRHGELRGYSFDTLSRPLVRRDLSNFDYIFAMDQSKYQNILKLDLNGEFQNRVFRIMEFSQKFEENEVPDPYYGGAEGFELVIDMLEDACEEVFNRFETGQL
jgi:protein-tyrosine phosphatase